MSVQLTQVEESDRSFTFVAEQDVRATVDQFDSVIGRPREMGEWFGVEFTWPTCPNHQLDVGSAVEFRAPVGPLGVEFIMIVADRVAGESLMFRTTRGAVDVTLEYAWRPVSTGTRVRLTMNFRVRGAVWWRSPWTRVVARRKILRGMEAMRRQFADSTAMEPPVPELVGGAAVRSRVAVASAGPRPVAAHRAATRPRPAHHV